MRVCARAPGTTQTHRGEKRGEELPVQLPPPAGYRTGHDGNVFAEALTACRARINTTDSLLMNLGLPSCN